MGGLSISQPVIRTMGSVSPLSVCHPVRHMANADPVSINGLRNLLAYS